MQQNISNLLVLYGGLCYGETVVTLHTNLCANQYLEKISL